jgi:hypothetical protein
MTLPQTVITKLTVARHLFRLAEVRARRDVTAFSGVTLMQDAVEQFLLAVAEHQNADIAAKTPFEGYLDRINEKLRDRELPFRVRLLQLNTARVSAKHHGLRPDQKSLEGFVTVVREFFEETCRAVLKVEFWTVSLIDLLDEGAVKSFLLAASAAFDKGDYRTALIECRKAVFRRFEKPYDARPFLEARGFSGVALRHGALGLDSKVPIWATDPKWIEEHATDPFGYIVLDVAELNRELLELGVDPNVFWNIWRLTPAVYQERPVDDEAGESEWLVKEEVRLFEPEGLRDRASHVLDATLDLMLTDAARRRSMLSVPYSRYSQRLKRKGVKVYARADRGSPVRAVTADDVDRLYGDAFVPGLKHDGWYWYVTHVEHLDDAERSRLYLGYVHVDDLDLGAEGSDTRKG